MSNVATLLLAYLGLYSFVLVAGVALFNDASVIKGQLSREVYLGNAHD